MRIEKLKSGGYEKFKALFRAYYDEMDCDEEIDHLLNEYVLADFEAELLDIALAFEGGEACGFVIWQVDGIENEWCLKEGMGDVRELYVIPAERQKGVGSALLSFAEGQLKAAKVKEVYTLPTEGSEAFFLAKDYLEADEFCEETGCNFFYKEL